MRLELILTSEEDIRLPQHYKHHLMGFLYHQLLPADVADFVHNKGFCHGAQSFPMMCLSNVLVKGRKDSEGLNFGKSLRIMVSSGIDPLMEFIAEKEGADLNFHCNQVTIKECNLSYAVISGEKIHAQTLSPIVSERSFPGSEGRRTYFRPEEEDFSQIIYGNLIKKYEVLHGSYDYMGAPVTLKPLGRTHQYIDYVKNLVVKGEKGEFTIQGDPRLLQIGYDNGFGSRNPQGFGMVELIQ